MKTAQALLLSLNDVWITIGTLIAYITNQVKPVRWVLCSDPIITMLMLSYGSRLPPTFFGFSEHALNRQGA